MSRTTLLAMLGVVVLACRVVLADAHTGGSTGYASVSVHRSTVRYSLTLPTAVLPSQLAEDLRLAQRGSVQARERLLDVLRQRIELRGNGTRCEPGPGAVDLPAPEATSVSMLVDFACPTGLRSLEIRDDIFDVLGGDHHTLAKLEWSGGTRQFAFEPTDRQARFSLGEATTRDAGSFVLLGVEHILTGWDHLL